MDYALLKSLHMLCAGLSISLFCWRAMLVLRGLALARTLKILPHVIDTVLLACGVSMAIMARLNPAQQPWLGLKLGCLLAYIILGKISLAANTPPKARRAALAGALLVFAYMLKLALSKQAGW
ncbi:SirB2 family protein [Massilia sp. W12]|uniref:SirB2 family protein n=1 Tax=Massilia sp. W12 TaxID=3126507 RepID=UPI0030CE6F2E